MEAIEKSDPNFTETNWNHSPNTRWTVALKGKQSTPQQLLNRIGTLKAENLKDVSTLGKNFVAQLIAYVLDAVPSVKYSPRPNRSDLVTFLTQNKFSDVFGIKKVPTGENAEYQDITQAEINDHIDEITGRTVNDISLHNPKRIRRRQAYAMGLRLFNHAKQLITVEYPKAVMPANSYHRTLRALIMTWGDIGTTKSVTYSDVEMTVFFRESPVAASISRLDFTGTEIIVPTLGGLPTRRAARYFALPALNYAKQFNHAYTVGQMHGVPPQYGYLGYDFGDSLPATNSVEAAVKNLARDAGLFKESRRAGQYINTSTRFVRSGYDNNSGGMSTNA